ncbi:amino acid ABC transporter substrate-binding protein [Paenibacillus psychroresistens]|uniref:Amino acid ABC transporter substrate-binding protein n=1 Tax=Paenibacillus psychroresistens TaxID=1778678 RepID=A0A6B8RX55_9BACL|nr:transporter substrate-binding domain-containing protein [Paenibacillus psychroresistens]QGQ99933.1 amino acid ABC transporter substrate-binding protein [Paenibacillus psychroresistens]
MSLMLVLVGCGKKDDSTEPAASGAATVSPAGDAEASKAIEAIKKRGKFVVGVKYDTNLFGLKDPGTGEVNGFDIDIAKAIAKSILGDETKIELKEVTSKTRIPMLNNGDIDAIVATMTITEDRKKEVDFTDVYFNAGQSLLVKKGSPIKSIADLKKGTKVLGVKGSTSVKNIAEKAPDATVLQFDNYQDAFTALKAGQGDTLTTDNAILFGMTKQDPNYEMVGGNFTDEPYGIAVKKGEAAFAKNISDLLTAMKASGEYDKIYEKWLGEKPAK